MSAGGAMSAAGDSKPDSNKLESVIQVRGRGPRPPAAHRAIITGTLGVIIAQVARG